MWPRLTPSIHSPPHAPALLHSKTLSKLGQSEIAATNRKGNKDAGRFRESSGTLCAPAKWHRSHGEPLGAKACQTRGTHPIQSSGRGEGWLPFISTLCEPSPLTAARLQKHLPSKGPHCGIKTQIAGARSHRGEEEIRLDTDNLGEAICFLNTQKYES